MRLPLTPYDQANLARAQRLQAELLRRAKAHEETADARWREAEQEAAAAQRLRAQAKAEVIDFAQDLAHAQGLEGQVDLVRLVPGDGEALEVELAAAEPVEPAIAEPEVAPEPRWTRPPAPVKS